VVEVRRERPGDEAANKRSGVQECLGQGRHALLISLSPVSQHTQGDHSTRWADVVAIEGSHVELRSAGGPSTDEEEVHGWLGKERD